MISTEVLLANIFPSAFRFLSCVRTQDRLIAPYLNVFIFVFKKGSLDKKDADNGQPSSLFKGTFLQ